MHSIFITNGLGICSARRLADLWQAGLLHFIIAHKSRERDSLSDPACYPSMHRGKKEQGPCHGEAISFDSADSHRVLGGFSPACSILDFLLAVLFAVYLAIPVLCVSNWLSFFVWCHRWLTSTDCVLALDCYVASSERQIDFWRLSKELCLEILFSISPTPNLCIGVHLSRICNA